jgi:ADP-dependent NAD(P)H-hydrate dehydratase / NAD(P)H-hydrate epimerase
MTFQLKLGNGHQVARPLLTPPTVGTHKYERGHALVMSGPALKTGASRLSAQAALAVGAGLVTLIGDRAALAEQAAHITAVMLRIDDDELSYPDDRVRAIAVGPGAGATPALGQKVLKLLQGAAPVVLDADALTVFEYNNIILFNALRQFDVMTPHRGEFGRLFPDLAMLPPIEAAVAAAQRAGCLVLLKGSDTVIASSTGQWAINSHSSSWLATAGSGDVLTGLICGLLAQGVPSFDAAAIGAWLHGDIGLQAGPGLTADAMLGYIPLVLKGCLQEEGAKGE